LVFCGLSRRAGTSMDNEMERAKGFEPSTPTLARGGKPYSQIRRSPLSQEI
jgi:hypothetical protein